MASGPSHSHLFKKRMASNLSHRQLRNDPDSAPDIAVWSLKTTNSGDEEIPPLYPISKKIINSENSTWHLKQNLKQFPNLSTFSAPLKIIDIPCIQIRRLFGTSNVSAVSSKYGNFYRFKLEQIAMAWCYQSPKSLGTAPEPNRTVAGQFFSSNNQFELTIIIKGNLAVGKKWRLWLRPHWHVIQNH